MIDFVELAPLGCKLYLFVFVIVVNHVGFIRCQFFVVTIVSVLHACRGIPTESCQSACLNMRGEVARNPLHPTM